MAAIRKFEFSQTDPMNASSDYVQNVKLEKRPKMSENFRKANSGDIKRVNSRNAEEQKLQHEKETWLAQDRKIRLELELERKHAKVEIRKSGAWEKMSRRERETWAASENRRIETFEVRMAQDRFKHYKPKVELKYVDDFGRNMSQKKAFKHLSHQFYGKDSGSGKTAKKLAKIEKEKLAEQRTIF
ncbi:SART-1 family-domain-containing protein [Protomyces lactucae-debilis]|uniref:SART-1 family-domain-containing protein n=1 Tax=Protomyces lactucae-debilis TaxID=2754530 RepID=A0A1Y2FST7_PROLT|nr:SART-1 family-domain-containing protein [Protomyces lactucae-debilis]ORY87060.1 SART-1 family-domain-containing protein [Protomyces lactucae-debilis]